MLREGERVTPLELFFDLVFVLALTRCTALVEETPTWEGMLKALLVLAVLWWAWGGYAWLTSVVDPEEGAVRLVMLAAMAALLVCSLSVHGVFGSEGLLFACAYLVVRVAHILLFLLASRDDRRLRSSVTGLAFSTALGTGILIGASFTQGWLRIGLWGVALVIDTGGPFLFGIAGWRLVPGHFAERHGAFVIIALGESIVALGVVASGRIDAGVVLAAVLGVALCGAFWWLYFDIVALVGERRLSHAREGRERNELARDSYSYLHLPMIAGIALVAVGLRQTLIDVSHPLALIPAVAMIGGTSLYLLAHVAFRLRNVRRLNVQRLAVAIALPALLPAARTLPSVATLAILTAVVAVLILYESLRYAELRARLRPHQGAAA